MSIDRQALFDQIYAPIFTPPVRGHAEQLRPDRRGPVLPADNFQNTYDPARAEKILTDAGWEKDGSGMWAKDGNVPEVKWMINAGNSRRENTQDYLIPLLAQAGFNVVADNCEAECVFQQRLPTGDWDMAMYISTAPPDPTYLVPSFTCDNIPTEENDFQGQNNQFWCNQEASDALPRVRRDAGPRRPCRARQERPQGDGHRPRHAAAGELPEVGRLAHRQGGRSGRRRDRQLPGVLQLLPVGGHRR
jgi:ABC-type transport system substrate-binding protein